MKVLFDDIAQAVGAELFGARILCFGNAVRINNERVAGLELRAAFAEVGGRVDAERDAAGRELFDLAGRAHDERWVVSGVDVLERARPRVELGVEERDEMVGRNVFGKIIVDVADRANQRLLGGGLRVDRRVERRHQKRRARSLARHVAERDH